MKFLKTIFKLIIFILFGVLVYYLSFNLSKKYINDVNLQLTYDDTDTFTLENVNKLSKEDALKEWPYIFNIKNKSKRDSDYYLTIKDVSGNIKRDKLSYVIYVNDKKQTEGKLSDIKDNILVKNHIKGNDNQEYKLYIYVSSDLDTKIEELSYEYKIELEFK